MFLPILTLVLCMTRAHVSDQPEETTLPANLTAEPLYNINEWVANLHLQRCALVAIGLKYFAIFVEDEILGAGVTTVRRKYFLGVCQQSTLEEWAFCSPNLSKKRKHKCQFKLSTKRYHPRVHRRFCDLGVMLNNKDCQCTPTIFGDELVKVKGFPTCYIPPLPESLCKYNVCGLSKCRASTIADRIYTVECNAACKGGAPFCEYPVDRTSRAPEVRSSWSQWRERLDDGDSPHTNKKHFVSTCINKYTKQGALDCLGPGTSCCPASYENCTCKTYEQNGILKVEKTAIIKRKGHHRIARTLDERFVLPFVSERNTLYRYVRGNDDEDIEDDDEPEDDDLDEDIVLEENPDEETTVSTTEALEKEEAIRALQKEVMQEINNSTNTDSTISSLESKGSSSLLGIHIVLVWCCRLYFSVKFMLYLL